MRRAFKRLGLRTQDFDQNDQLKGSSRRPNLTIKTNDQIGIPKHFYIVCVNLFPIWKVFHLTPKFSRA